MAAVAETIVVRTRIALLLAGLVLGIPAPAGADEEAGKDLFVERCITCHSIECTRRGPKLEGILGESAAADPDYRDYSEALRGSEVIWDEVTLGRFVADPQTVVPGTSMFLGGIDKIDDAEDRRNLIAFLKSGESAGFCS